MLHVVHVMALLEWVAPMWLEALLLCRVTPMAAVCMHWHQHATFRAIAGVVQAGCAAAGAIAAWHLHLHLLHVAGPVVHQQLGRHGTASGLRHLRPADDLCCAAAAALCGAGCAGRP